MKNKIFHTQDLCLRTNFRCAKDSARMEIYMIKEAIVKIVNKGDLSYDEAYAVMNEIMNGETSPTQNAAFLAAL